MEFTLAYYERRNAQIMSKYKVGHSLEYLCSRYELKEARVRQILELPRCEPKPRGPVATLEVMQRLGLSKYKVRGAVLRSEGRWPYPLSLRLPK